MMLSLVLLKEPPVLCLKWQNLSIVELILSRCPGPDVSPEGCYWVEGQGLVTVAGRPWGGANVRTSMPAKYIGSRMLLSNRHFGRVAPH